jgi:hypothetical protein
VAPRAMAMRANTPWKMRTMRMGEMYILMDGISVRCEKGGAGERSEVFAASRRA